MKKHMESPQLHITTFTSQMLMMVGDLGHVNTVHDFFVYPSLRILAAADTDFIKLHLKFKPVPNMVAVMYAPITQFLCKS